MFRTLIACALLCASAAHAQEAVILVRHAELDVDGASGVDPRLVPLSAAGNARAERLARLLERSGIGAIYATDFARTRQTAEPAARLLGREVTVVAKADPADFVARLRRDHASEVVLVVGHTDTLPGIIAALGYVPKITIDSTDFANVFVLTPKGSAPPAFVRLRY